MSALQSNTIDDLGFGSFVPKAADDADVKFYKEQLGKDIIKGEEIYVKTNERFSDIKQTSKQTSNQTQTTDYDDVTSIAQTIKSGNYQDIAFPGNIISIKKSESVPIKKGQNFVSVKLKVGNKFEIEEFDLNNETSLISLAEEIFKGSSKEIRSKRSEFVKQMLSKNKVSASDDITWTWTPSEGLSPTNQNKE